MTHLRSLLWVHVGDGIPRTVTDPRVLKTEYLSEMKQQKLNWKPIKLWDFGIGWWH